MTETVALSGSGRIGRCVLRALTKAKRKDLRIAAINDLSPLELSVHLLKWDSTYGPYPGKVAVGRNALKIDGRNIPYSSTRDVGALPWHKLGIDVVLECTGVLADRSKAAPHLAAGAARVLISAPATGGRRDNRLRRQPQNAEGPSTGSFRTLHALPTV